MRVDVRSGRTLSELGIHQSGLRNMQRFFVRTLSLQPEEFFVRSERCGHTPDTSLFPTTLRAVRVIPFFIILPSFSKSKHGSVTVDFVGGITNLNPINADRARGKKFENFEFLKHFELNKFEKLL